MQERLRDLYNRRAMEEQRKREEEEEARMRAEAEENEWIYYFQIYNRDSKESHNMRTCNSLGMHHGPKTYLFDKKFIEFNY